MMGNMRIGKKNNRATRALISDKYKNLAKSKRSQHEIVGFILIVVIVVIIGLFLLVFYLRQTPISYKSANVENFLRSSMHYTSNCVISIEPLNMQDLIKSCYKNDRCIEGGMACDVLENALSELVHESWSVGEKTVNSYFLDVYYEEKTGNKTSITEEILSLKDGNCTGSKTGAEHYFHYGRGNIHADMEICYT